MEDQNFKFSFFGGFNKKSVVEYVTKIVNNFNAEIDSLKKDYEKQLEQKSEEIAGLSTSLKKSDEVVSELKAELLDARTVEQSSSDAKQLEEKEALIVKMRSEIEDLKKAVSQSKNEGGLLEERIQKAQSVAKERVNEVVEQARAKIAMEYRKKMEDSEQEGRAVRNEAIKEASKILNNSAEVAHKIIKEAKGKIKKFVMLANQEVKDLVDYANLVAQEIVKKSADSIFSERKSSLVDKFSLDVEVKKVADSVESKFKIDDELFGAVKKLNADFLLEEAGDAKFVLNNKNNSSI